MATQVEETTTNLIGARMKRVEEAAEQAVEGAAVVCEHRLATQRVGAAARGVGGAAASNAPATGEYTVWITSQCPHIMRLLRTAFVFGIQSEEHTSDLHSRP